MPKTAGKNGMSAFGDMGSFFHQHKENNNLIEHEIVLAFRVWGLTYPKWIQRCYIQRMAQILNDPADFGKVVLEGKKRDHCIQNADLDCLDD
jgi:hypothetical protein